MLTTEHCGQQPPAYPARFRQTAFPSSPESCDAAAAERESRVADRTGARGRRDSETAEMLSKAAHEHNVFLIGGCVPAPEFAPAPGTTQPTSADAYAERSGRFRAAAGWVLT